MRPMYNLEMTHLKQENVQKHWWLYVLRLEESKWYIGITSQSPERRFQEHLGGRKTYWTEKYKPLEIYDQKYLGDLNLEEAEAYENKVTREYMKAKGINNVRGGDLVQKDDYIVRFGYIFDKYGWEAAVVVIFLLLSEIVLLLDKYGW